MTFLGLPRSGLRVLAVGAHPDDIEIGCGATLISLTASGGTSLATIVMTGTEARRVEAAEAAEAFGSTVPPRLLGLPDARLPESWGAVKEALHAFAAEHPGPDLVFAPRPDDAHQDHALLGALVTTVWRGPTILHYEIPKWDGDLGRPQVYVAVPPPVLDQKITLLDRVFPSQRTRDWWDDELFRGLARIRGVESRNRYAEAFFIDKLEVAIS